MDVDSDDDFERVSVPGDISDAESDFGYPTARTSSTPAPSTPATTQGTPYCREKRLKCPYDGCDKAFNRPTRLQEHIRSHTNERPFQCPHHPCTKTYLRESHLKHHLKSAHSEIRDFKCSHEGCDKAFATGQRLRVHQATHQGKNNYVCRDYPPCNQVFRKKETLQRHVQTAHESTLPFPCTKIDTRTGQPCNKAYDTASKLATHDRSVHDPTRFSCDQCLAHNAAIAADTSLTEAQKIAKSKSANFATYAELQDHNSNEHPPTCSKCALPFNTSRELTRHNELIHGVVNPNTKPSNRVSCPEPGCDKTFSRTGNLNIHIRTAHENRRDFICGQSDIALGDVSAGTEVTGCGRDFASKAQLGEHVRTVHLGLESAQTLRTKRKRRSGGFPPEAKKPRKDKGIRKTAAISGSAPPHERFPFGNDEDEDGTMADSILLDDEDNELDGSMTMYGSMLYDPNGAYRYDDGEYPASSQHSQSPALMTKQPFPQFQTNEILNDGNTYQSSSYGPEHFECDLDLNTETHPGAFTLEPEMSNALDPALFLSTPSQQQRGLSSSRY